MERADQCGERRAARRQRRARAVGEVAAFLREDATPAHVLFCCFNGDSESAYRRELAAFGA